MKSQPPLGGIPKQSICEYCERGHIFCSSSEAEGKNTSEFFLVFHLRMDSDAIVIVAPLIRPEVNCDGEGQARHESLL